jgi:hypothetical protein
VKCWVFGASWGDQLTDVISSLIDYVIHLTNSRDRDESTPQGISKRETVAQAREETESKTSSGRPKTIVCSNHSRLCGHLVKTGGKSNPNTLAMPSSLCRVSLSSDFAGYHTALHVNNLPKHHVTPPKHRKNSSDMQMDVSNERRENGISHLAGHPQTRRWHH